MLANEVLQRHKPRVVNEPEPKVGDEHPRIAVVMASWNGAAFIRQQIESIIWQQGCDVVLYIRDDSSNDDTRSIVDQYTGLYHYQVRLIDDGRGASGSAAQNFFRALLAVRSEAFDYLALADQDDIWEANKLARALDELRRTGAHGYSSNLNAFAVDGSKPVLVRKDQPQVAFDYLFQSASAGCTFLLSRPLFDHVAQFLADNDPNPDIIHDILIYAIARSHGFSWTHDAAAHVLYRQHGRNLFGARIGLSGVRERWRLIRSGWYRAQTRLMRPYLAGNASERRVLQAVSRYSLADRLWLAANAFRCRRRKVDAIAFALMQLVP